MYAWRLNTSSGLGTLVSSKVNQWTLLIGTLPIAFAIFSGGWHGLPLDPAQREEVLLTAAQSVFAVTVLANLSLSVLEAVALLGLFLTQFLAGALLPADMHGAERLSFTAAYLLLAAAITITQHRSFRNLARDGFRTPYAELEESV
jgi:cation:H+ antiporter